MKENSEMIMLMAKGFTIKSTDKKSKVIGIRMS